MDDDRDSALAMIARLYYIENMDQREIAKLVGISRSQISRLLQQARERGIVRISVDPYEPRCGDLEARLVDRFGLTRAVVIRTLRSLSGLQIRQTIGRFAGPVVSEWIKPGNVIGFAGGRTVAEVVSHLASGEGAGRGVTTVQLMGNIGPDLTAIDAIELTRAVAGCFGGVYYALSAPVLVLDNELRDALMGHEHMRSIWRLIGMMDQAFVGIGTLADSAFIDRGVLSGADRERLHEAGAVGEICGRFYDVDGQECDTEYRDRVISVTLEELRAVPEVTAITHSGDRSPAIVAALRGRLIKSLVIDEEGARGLLRE